jgi:hypothetical protein
MKIKLGLRGSSDAVYGIIVKFDDLSLVSSDNIFLIGEENRNKMGENLVELLDSLSKDHEISVSENVSKEIERELNLKNNEIKKYSNE